MSSSDPKESYKNNVALLFSFKRNLQSKESIYPPHVLHIWSKLRVPAVSYIIETHG